MKTVNKKVRRKPAAKKNKITVNHRVSGQLVKAQNYYEYGQLEQANYLYQQVLQQEPENLSALNGLGIIAMDAGMLSIAAEIFNTASTIDADNLTINKNLALVYSRLTQYDAAIHLYSQIIDNDEENHQVYGELARLYLQTGAMELALTHYRIAFDLNPEDPRNFHGMVQIDAQAITEEHIDIVENLLRKQDLLLDDRCSFYFALGEIYDASERYDEAFANYAVANIAKAVKFDSEKHVDYITAIMNTFTPEIFEEFDNSELNNSTQPVFIVGMPRSGTAVVEQILASHSDVYAGGELNLINEIAEKLQLTIEQTDKQHMFFENNSEKSLSGFARYYINDINNLALNNNHKNPSRITDKMPTNFLYLGLITLLFPKAKIIHCRRNPLDVSLSCYFKDFADDHGYACDLKNIGLYYQQYERLMAHWKKVLATQIHTVDYEELVENTQAASKELIKFIALDWQQGCKQFNKTKRTFHKASPVQVRTNMYQPKVNHWFYYDNHLHLLKKSLNIFNSVDTAR